jgi:hypothetical protein
MALLDAMRLLRDMAGVGFPYIALELAVLRLSVVTVLTVAALASCTHDVKQDKAPTTEISDDTQAVFAVPNDVISERVYLGSTNLVDVSEETPWVYGIIDLEAGAKIGIELSTTDGYADWIGFKVYKVSGSGQLNLLGVLDGEGYAAAVLRSTTGGSFVIEAVSEWLPSTLALDLSCLKANGKCARFTQPGGACGSRGITPCDGGLMCQIPSGCGRADEAGTCERPVEICPAVVGAPVCGCDGATYNGACNALAAGINVDFAGACPGDPGTCDPSVFSKVMDGFMDVSGTWINKVRHDDYFYEVTSKLVLGADGNYTYEQIHTPLCIADRDVEGTVLCRMPSLFFTSSGFWENQGFAVQLHPDSNGSPDQLAQSFGIAMNCEGAIRLDTIEMNFARTLERDPCGSVACGDTEHCEMVQVQCITTPCNPVATCVAN